MQHPDKGVVRGEYEKEKTIMEILWMIIQTVMILIIAGWFIYSIWIS